MICPACGGRGWVGNARADQFRHLANLALAGRLPTKPCTYEGCVNGTIACDDVPNDGLPKGDAVKVRAWAKEGRS